MTMIRCAIWNQLHFNAELGAIIRLEQFQRLRNVKQLGFVPLLYPGAIHSRYEHCLGTAHLCGKLLDALERNSHVIISQFHRKCVIAAGLLHDVGHGPFSHVWEHIGGKHEEMSGKIVDIILTEGVPAFFSPTERDAGIELVRSLINGDSALLSCDDKYLAEIVSNKYCEVDVDKWDYIMRDLYYLREVDGVHVNQDAFDFFHRAQLQRDEKGVMHIAYRLEDQAKLRHFFETRRKLRQRVYLHPSIREAEATFRDKVLWATESGFRFNGRTLAEASLIPEEFQLLDDSINNHLERFLKDNREKRPEIYERFKNKNRQFTNYLNYQSEHEEEVQMKSPLFFSDTGVQQIPLPY